ncbi:ATP phosphoribosyltransferase regulatory subunit [Aurantivibrio infirmus]
MTSADRWLLPDGVEEILPEQAQQIENLRRELLNLYSSWGYKFVIPPLVEFTDSLLTGLGRDLDLLTFKVTDQLSGRTLGIRADITPQTARMDAHSLKLQGVNRLCYAGHVLYTKPKAPLATRTPIVSGVELYGEEGLGADIEVVSLLLESLRVSGLQKAAFEIGHVGIYRAIITESKLSEAQQEELFDLLRRKAFAETKTWVNANIADKNIGEIICTLPKLDGDYLALASAREKLHSAPKAVLAAIEELERMAQEIAQRFPEAQIYFGLSELHSFDYHTGLVFAAFAPNFGRALAVGGRYDHVGNVFGRSRPATGFHVDVTALNQLLTNENIDNDTVAKPGIYAPFSEDSKQWQAVQRLRQQGEIVVNGFENEEVFRQEINCDRRLENIKGEYKVVDWPL